MLLDYEVSNMRFLISNKVRDKLKDPTHSVTEDELLQAFANRTGPSLQDSREKHKTNPPTQWFVSETDYGRKLKVMYILHEGGIVEIKSSYNATAEIQRIYAKFS